MTDSGLTCFELLIRKIDKKVVAHYIIIRGAKIVQIE